MYKTHWVIIRRNTDICRTSHLPADKIISYIFIVDTFQDSIITYMHIYNLNFISIGTNI